MENPFDTVRAVMAHKKNLADDGFRFAPLQLLLAAALILLREEDVRMVDLYNDASRSLGMGSISIEQLMDVDEALEKRKGTRRRSDPLREFLPPSQEASAIIVWFHKQNIAVPKRLLGR